MKVGIDLTDPLIGVISEVQVIVTPGQRMIVGYVSEENILPQWNFIEGNTEMTQEIFSLDNCFELPSEQVVWDEEAGDYKVMSTTLYLWLGSYKVAKNATLSELFKTEL